MIEMNKTRKIQAILTINEKGDYNICGWNPSQNMRVGYDHIKEICQISEDGLDHSQPYKTQKQYLIETVIEIPEYSLTNLHDNFEIKEIK
jgi:hypothetical protein